MHIRPESLINSAVLATVSTPPNQPTLLTHYSLFTVANFINRKNKDINW